MSSLYRSILNVQGSSFASTNSFEFDGSTDYVIVPNSTSLNITTAMSVSMWFKTTSSSGMYALTQGSGSEIKHFVQFYAPINRIRIQIWDGNSVSTIIDNTQAFNDGQWHHIAFTTDALTTTDGVKIYFDGTLLTNKGTLSNNGIRSISTPFYIGQIPNTSRFNGNIDEVAVFNSELSQSDVSSIATAPSDLSTYGSLVSWWRMGEAANYAGGQWTLTDQGSGGNDGTSTTIPAPPAQPSTDVPI